MARTCKTLRGGGDSFHREHRSKGGRKQFNAKQQKSATFQKQWEKDERKLRRGTANNIL